MNPPPMLDVNAPSLPTADARHAVLRPLAAAAGLGLVLFYGVAFADSPIAHNAAHDVRHITVKPCH